jgi:hypothetical protein
MFAVLNFFVFLCISCFFFLFFFCSLIRLVTVGGDPDIFNDITTGPCGGNHHMIFAILEFSIEDLISCSMPMQGLF